MVRDIMAEEAKRLFNTIKNYPEIQSTARVIIDHLADIADGTSDLDKDCQMTVMQTAKGFIMVSEQLFPI